MNNLVHRVALHKMRDITYASKVIEYIERQESLDNATENDEIQRFVSPKAITTNIFKRSMQTTSNIVVY